MATSGNFKGSTGNQYISCKIVWSAEQSISGNYSDVTATLYYSRTNTDYTTSGTWKGSITINGTKTSGSKSMSITYNSNTKAMSATTRVYHNTDGTKSCAIKASGSISGTSLDSTSISSTVTLTTIARASSITSVSNATLGSTSSIKWTPASKSFYYKVKLVLGDWSWTSGAIHPNQTSAYTYTTPNISLSVANQLPKATSGTMTAYLYTYSNSACTTKIGSTYSKTFTVTVPSSVKPEISSAKVSIVNSNAVIAEWGVYVKGYSQAKITASASGKYSSTISSFTISGGYSVSKSGTSLSYTGDVFSTSGDKIFNVVAKDSRGRSSDSVKAGEITVYAYSAPTISTFTVSRSSSDSTKMVAKCNYSFSSVNGKNSATATLYYKKSTATSWTTYGTIADNVSTTLTKTFEEASSYNFKVVVKDALSKTATSPEAFVSTVSVLMDFRSGGKGLGIGKMAESNALEIGLDTKFFGKVYINGVDIDTYIKNLVT